MRTHFPNSLRSFLGRPLVLVALLVVLAVDLETLPRWPSGRQSVFGEMWRAATLRGGVRGCSLPHASTACVYRQDDGSLLFVEEVLPQPEGLPMLALCEFSLTRVANGFWDPWLVTIRREIRVYANEPAPTAEGLKLAFAAWMAGNTDLSYMAQDAKLAAIGNTSEGSIEAAAALHSLGGLFLLFLTITSMCLVPHELLATRRSARLARGTCPTCGYDIRGLPESICPECGACIRRSD